MIRITFDPKVIKNPLLSLLAYGMVFVLVGFSIAFLCFNFYGFQNPVDWILAGIYICLSLFSYYVFMVNDMNANSFKGRTTALAFLAVHLALSVFLMSFIFNVPTELVWYVAGSLLSLSYLLGFYGVTRWAKNHRELRNQMHMDLLTDELTQLYNRRALAQHAFNEEQFASDANTHLSVLIIDIDDFKLVNDRYGHSVGDELLRQVSQLFKRRIGELGEVYRWGGEEFVVILPVTGLFEANKVANKLVNKISEYVFNIKDLLDLKISVSVGVAQWNDNESICKATLERADRALYKAKSSGKNKAVSEFSDFSNISELKVKQQNLDDQTKLA